MFKKLIGLTFTMMVVFALTACGGGANEPAAPAPAQGGGGAATPVPAAGGDTDGITLIIPYLGLTDDQIAIAQELGEMDTPYNLFMYNVRRTIEAEMPNADVQFVDWGWAESLDSQQRARIMAGDPSDLVVGEIFMPTYANEGILYPLPQDIVDMVNPSFLINDPDGNPVAVAARATVFMLFYNKDLMEAAGLDPNAPPRTWEEWQYQSDRITAAGNGEFWGGGVPSFPHAGGALRATPFFRQMGTDFFMDGQVRLDDPNLHTALEFIREMNRNLPPGLGNAASEDPMWNAFEQTQNIAFVVNGTWQAGGAERNNMNWGVAPLPIPAGGQEGNCLVAAFYMAVPRGVSNPEASFDVIRVALREEYSRFWLDDPVASPLRSIIDNRATYAAHSAALATAMDALAGGQVSGLATFPANDSQIWEIVNTQILARTTITEDPIETITQDALRQIQTLLP